MKERIPVTVITGFLGAGKTTLLSNLIKDTGHERFAILVNEFGEVSIDDAVLRSGNASEAVEFHTLANGLVAYSGDTHFLATMLMLKERCDQIDHVIVETSGLAVPSALIEILQSEQLKDNFVLDATLAVIDTLELLGAESKIVSDEFRDGSINSRKEVFQLQLDCSDVIVLNKIDDLGDEQLLEAEARIRKQSPSVRFVELAYAAHLDKRVVLGLRLNESRSQEIDYRLASGGKQVVHGHDDGHDHSGLGPHEHGIMTHQHVHEHDPDWISFVLHSHDLQDRNIFEKALLAILQTEALFRVKGTVQFKGWEHPALVQAVASRLVISEQNDLVAASHRHVTQMVAANTLGARITQHVVTHEHENLSGASDRTELVFIGYQIDRLSIADCLSEHTRADWH